MRKLHKAVDILVEDGPLTLSKKSSDYIVQKSKRRAKEIYWRYQSQRDSYQYFHLHRSEELSNLEKHHLTHIENGSDDELHLFIVWENGMSKYKKIEKDISKLFQILNIYEIQWSPDSFSENLSRFYGTNLPAGSNKEEHIGTGPFRLIVVRDGNPDYSLRNTSSGWDVVNRNMYRAKNKYRRWTGGGHKIHATNSFVETNHDLTLLLGKNPKDFNKENGDWNGKVNFLSRDLIGADGWGSLNELFYVLNSTVNYLVLRNFEPLLDEFYLDKHGDIDLLTDDYEEMCYMTNSNQVYHRPYRVHNEVEVAGETLLFDFRHIGDNYYDDDWAYDILKNKIMSDEGFFRPTDRDYYYSLLYHALIHKHNFAQDYKERLHQMGSDLGLEESLDSPQEYGHNKKTKNILDNYICQMAYDYTEPYDKSVGYNKNNNSKW